MANEKKVVNLVVPKGKGGTTFGQPVKPAVMKPTASAPTTTSAKK